MITFKSIAVLDTETTSLPEADHRTTKITELALLGCEIDHVKDCEVLPRVLHKLVLLFNPLKAIHPSATHTTGLSNELLMNIKPFTEQDAGVLEHFISRLPSPVCIVAHNGKKFDFPILRRALEKVKKNFPNNVYCADTLEAFKKLLPAAATSFSPRCSQKQAENEKTPEHQRTQPVNSLSYKSAVRELFPSDEEQFPNNREFSEWASSQDGGVCNREFSEWPSSQDGGICNRKVCPRSYKLGDIYYFFFKGYFPESHRAEEDTKALLNCIIQCKGFWEWMNKNAIIFNSIEPL